MYPPPPPRHLVVDLGCSFAVIHICKSERAWVPFTTYHVTPNKVHEGSRLDPKTVRCMNRERGIWATKMYTLLDWVHMEQLHVWQNVPHVQPISSAILQWPRELSGDATYVFSTVRHMLNMPMRITFDLFGLTYCRLWAVAVPSAFHQQSLLLCWCSSDAVSTRSQVSSHWRR